MCNGIAIIIYEKDNELKSLCTGISSHDKLCRLDDELRYGKIEPWRFELIYPCSLTYDRGHDKPLGMGVCGEQPEQKIWDIALKTAIPYIMKHQKNQLQRANLTYVNLTGANKHHSGTKA